MAYYCYYSCELAAGGGAGMMEALACHPLGKPSNEI